MPSENPVLGWLYDWVVSLWIVWLLIGGTTYGVAARLLEKPSQQPAPLISPADVDLSGTR